MAVQKRGTETISEVPDEVVDEPVGLTINEKFLPVPRLTMKQYRKMLKLLSDLDKNISTPEDDIFLYEMESMNATQEFYFQLFKIGYPDLKKADLENIGAEYYSSLYFMKIKTAILSIPLA